MPLKNYYGLLDLVQTASHDEIKRAFREQIARYHPDKVQHLGQEFQAMAAERAAELTEAYRMLSDEGRRAEYDRAFALSPPPPAAAPTTTGRAAQPSTETAPPLPVAEAPTHGAQFKQERATVDQFVRNATISRFRSALAVVGAYDESDVRGFDVACVPKSKLFARSKPPKLLGRFVARVDAQTVADAWMQASKWSTADEVCIFLMGSGMAAPAELAKAIAEQRRKTRAANVTLIPIDARNWEAHVPTDAPSIAKDLLLRLRSGG